MQLKGTSIFLEQMILYNTCSKGIPFLLRDKGMYNRNGLGEKELFSRQAFFALNETIVGMGGLLHLRLNMDMCIINKMFFLQTFFNIFGYLMPFNNG